MFCKGLSSNNIFKGIASQNCTKDLCNAKQYIIFDEKLWAKLCYAKIAKYSTKFTFDIKTSCKWSTQSYILEVYNWLRLLYHCNELPILFSYRTNKTSHSEWIRHKENTKEIVRSFFVDLLKLSVISSRWYPINISFSYYTFTSCDNNSRTYEINK